MDGDVVVVLAGACLIGGAAAGNAAIAAAGVKITIYTGFTAVRQ